MRGVYLVLALLLEAPRQGLLVNFRDYRREILAIILVILFFLGSDIYLLLLLDLIWLAPRILYVWKIFCLLMNVGRIRERSHSIKMLCSTTVAPTVPVIEKILKAVTPLKLPMRRGPLAVPFHHLQVLPLSLFLAMFAIFCRFNML
jgi:hypothetical protein